MPGFPLWFDGVERQDVQRAPQLGERSEQVVAEVMTLSPAEIGRLHDRRIVAGPATQART